MVWARGSNFDIAFFGSEKSTLHIKKNQFQSASSKEIRTALRCFALPFFITQKRVLLRRVLLSSAAHRDLFCVKVCAPEKSRASQLFSSFTSDLTSSISLAKTFWTREIVLSHCENVQALVTHTILFISFSLSVEWFLTRVCWRLQSCQHAGSI